jgi:2-polyprenyl-6-methoxyphenol hydroxylase-like FAD-dependent oxidoreductase
MTEITYDVLQIGMGPCGLMLGALLGQAGHTVAMIERHEALYGLPRAGHIDHEIVRILQSLGCHAPVLEDSYPTLEYTWVNADGETLLEFDWGAQGVSGWHSDYMQYQPVLEAALAERLERDPLVDAFGGWEAVAIRQHDDHVELEVRRTARVPGDPRPVITDESRVLRGRYLVGADGAGSFVRRWMGVEREDLGFNEKWLDVDARKKRELEFAFDCGQRCDPRRPITILPLGKRHRRWEWALLPGETVEEFERPDTAWRLLGELGVTPDDVEIVRQIVYTFEARIARQWRQGRVFLLGDACHTMPPFMGQGMCSGMRDAKNLVWKLDLVLRGLAPETILDSYQLERLPHARDWTVISLEAGKVPCTTDPLLAAERDARFRAGWMPPMPDFPQIEAGLLAHDADGQPARPAGELGLQARVTRAGRVALFDDVFDAGARWQLISIAGDPRAALGERQLRFLERLGTVFAHVGGAGEDADAVDVDGRYREHFEARGVQAMLTRPDFYVFGGVPSPASLPSLVEELERRLSDRDPGRSGTSAQLTHHELELATTEGGPTRH